MTDRTLEMNSSLKAFLADDAGSTTIETLVVFAPIMAMVFTNIELAMSYYSIVSAQKASQFAARIAATQDPIYIGGAMPMLNAVNTVDGFGPRDACFQDPGPDACLDPGGPFICQGSDVTVTVGPPLTAISSDPNCAGTGWAALLVEVQRFYPSVNVRDLTVTYIYRRLGYADGPFQPEIQVTVAPRELPVNLPSLLGFDTITGTLRGSTSSSFGEDMLSG
ncbi:MAG: hypothetical protein AAFV01_04375 [Bacteroidota bacterium]